MKNLSAALFILLLWAVACSKKETTGFVAEQELKMHYDTTAVDSFSSGATSVDIVRQIRMSSQKYKDSLVQVQKLLDEEKKLKAELEKENKRKLEEEKKKADAEKKQKETASSAVTTPRP